MLVKFRTIRDTDIIYLVDSKEIYCNKVNDENRIQRYKSKLSQYVLVDDATLAYLENAWLHEGMKRVKTDNIYGWSNGNYYDDKGILCVVVETDDGFVKAYEYTNTQFIPYEMEERK